MVSSLVLAAAALLLVSLGLLPSSAALPGANRLDARPGLELSSDPSSGRVGRVEFQTREGVSSCTVFLVGPREALTSTACLASWDYQPAAVRFGLHRSKDGTLVFSDRCLVLTGQGGPGDFFVLVLDVCENGDADLGYRTGWYNLDSGAPGDLVSLGYDAPLGALWSSPASRSEVPATLGAPLVAGGPSGEVVVGFVGGTPDAPAFRSVDGVLSFLDTVQAE